jgi:hypothetical protein
MSHQRPTLELPATLLSVISRLAEIRQLAHSSIDHHRNGRFNLEELYTSFVEIARNIRLVSETIGYTLALVENATDTEESEASEEESATEEENDAGFASEAE